MRRLAHLHHRDNKTNEPVWHVQLAIVAVIALQLILDSSLTIGSKYYIAIIELLLLLALMAVAYTAVSLIVRRSLAIVLTALVSASNILSLGLVIFSLFDGHDIDGRNLLISALAIYLTNIIIFGLWYWEMEFKRGKKPQDFLFPQENAPEHAGLHNVGWRPTFADYLYVSATNATAFSPTDTLPLTHRAKTLMVIQSLASIIIVVLVTARAVNIII
ncbi:MAG TPA: hypothetical protein VFW77_03710 [Candidatus Saccharimonadales bacterium]|nr:hypothetical protein [Candidatus Saccharimonadales bacterium]